MDPEHREAVALGHRLAGSCSVVIDKSKDRPEYAYRSVWQTQIRDLGEYGVGVRLYFDYLKFLGALFLLLSVLSFPMLIMNCMGNLINQQTPLKSGLWLFKAISGFCLANLGVLPSSDGIVSWSKTNGMRDMDTTFEERKVVEDGVQVSNVTGALGTIDGICVLIFVLAGAWFKHRYIPRCVQEQDDESDTPAHYTLTVTGLPRHLQDRHADYKRLLHEHFMKVLVDAGVPPADGLIEDIVLFRNYDQALSTYMEIGQLLHWHVDCIAKMKSCLAQGRDEHAEDHVLEARSCRDILRRKADDVGKAHVKDEERDVVVAYVSFQQAVFKKAVLLEYQKSVAWLPERFQPEKLLKKKEKLHFCGHPIIVAEAKEPSLIFYENLDYPNSQRRIRHCFILLLAVVVMLFTLLIVSNFRQVPISQKNFKGAPIWVVQLDQSTDNSHPQTNCFSACSWKFKSHHSEEGCVEHEGNLQISDINGTVGNFNGSSPCPLYCGNSIKPWVAVDFRQKLNLCDMRIHSEEPHAFMIAEIYACLKEDIPSGWDSSAGARSAFDPRRVCTKMGATRLHDVRYKDSGAHTVEDAFVEIKEDHNCEDSYYEDLDLQVLTRIHSDMSDYRIACYCTRMQNKGATPDVCSTWATHIEGKQKSYYAGLVIAIFLTQCNWALLTYFTRYAKYDCLSDLANMRMMLVFVAQFANVGFVAIVSSLDSHRFYARLGFGLFDNIFGARAFHDYTINWFVLVGSTVVIKLLGNICGYISQIPFKSVVVNNLYVWWFKARVLTIDGLKKLYVLPEFPFPSRLAATNTVVCSILMFSGGLPLLYPLGAFYCLLAYWSDKWSLLRGSCRPPAYDAAVFHLSVSLFPFTGALHILMSLSMYNNLLFPSDFGFLQGLFESLVNMDAEEQKVIFREWSSGMKDTWKLDLDEYLRARILDVSRVASTFLFLVFFFMSSYWIWRALRWAVTSIEQLYLLFTDKAQDKRRDSCCGFDFQRFQRMQDFFGGQFEHCVTEITYQEAKVRSEMVQQPFSYDFRVSKKYKPARWGLLYAQNELSEESFEEWARSIHYPSGKRLSQLLGFSLQKESAPVTDRPVSPTRQKEQEAHSHGRLWVTIISGHNLANKDVIGKSDPFCRCGVVNKPEMVFQTETIDDTLDPQWTYPEQNIAAWTEGDVLRFTVWDQDRIGKELLGRVTLTTDELHARLVAGVFEGELPLVEDGMHQTGKAMLRVRIRKTPAEAVAGRGHVPAEEGLRMTEMFEGLQGLRTSDCDSPEDTSGSSTKILPGVPESSNSSDLSTKS